MAERKENKTRGIKLYFWTDHLPAEIKNEKACWNYGSASLLANQALGIKSDDEQFNSIEDIPRAIKELLLRNGIDAVAEND